MQERNPTTQPDTLQILECRSLGKAQQNTLRLIQQARHEILIDTQYLDHALYSQHDIAKQLKTFCLTQSRARIHILLQEDDKIMAHGHLLLPLLQRLTSFIEIRRRPPLDFHETLIVDQQAFQVFSTPGSYEARYSFKHRPHSQHLAEQFRELWEPATRNNRLLTLHV